MKLPRFTTLFLIIAGFAGQLLAQSKKPAVQAKGKSPTVRSAEIGQSAIVVDETLAVLRKMPSLFSESVHRMSRGRKVQIQGVAEADGVKFYKVTVPPTNYGWVQADAVFGRFRANDEERLAKLVQAADGFELVEIAGQFFTLYPNSKFKPSLLLLFGDVLEEIAVKTLERRDIAAQPQGNGRKRGSAP